ncbi:MAG: hypothetical protein II875_09305 [Clostridia bacterium]|nr:hypothetical protein [Clostridia bacterium]
MLLTALGTSFLISIVGVLAAQWFYQSIEVSLKLFAIVAACLFPFVYLAFRLFGRKTNRPPQDHGAPGPSAAPAQPEKKELSIERNVNGAIVKYFYKRVDLKPRKDIPLETLTGRDASFSYNEETDKVSVLAEGKRVGTLVHPTAESVAKEWLRTGEPCRAVIVHADDEKRELSAALVFYRDELARRLKSSPDARAWRLMGVRSNDIQLAAALTRRGDRVQIDLDPANGKYAVLTEDGSVLGYLPAAAAKYYETLDPDAVSAFVAENGKDENGLCVPRVSIFDY